MQESSQHIEDLVARRLLKKASLDNGEARPEPPQHQVVPEQGSDQSLSEIDFIKIEKNLAELGFFTPASKRVKNLKFKSITFTRIIDGNRIEGKVTFVPGALYGLPSTADQDKWLAFQKFVTDVQQEVGRVVNPITFLSADMLRELGQADSGTNFKDIDEWLDRMWSTSIISEGMVYYAGKKVRVKDRTPIKVFTRAVTAGASLDDGTIAEKNYVWLSDWQLENVNNNYQMPVDFEAYKKLKNNIAKTLVPLLQIWLYATREKGIFEKRYDEICQLLNTTQYKHASKIVEKVGPSLDELKQHGYLSAWHVGKTSDGRGFKIIFKHGEKFYSDRRRRKLLREGESQPEMPEAVQEFLELPPTGPTVDQVLLSELTRRGISESKARTLLSSLPQGQHVMDQIEWVEHQITNAPQGKFWNPAGFLITTIKDNLTPPDSFESSRKRRLREEAEQLNESKRRELARLELAYDEYRVREIDSYIANLLHGGFEQMVEAKKSEFKKSGNRNQLFPPETITQIATGAARAELARRIQFDTFEIFCARQCGTILPVKQQLSLMVIDEATAKLLSLPFGSVTTKL